MRCDWVNHKVVVVADAWIVFGFHRLCKRLSLLTPVHLPYSFVFWSCDRKVVKVVSCNFMLLQSYSVYFVFQHRERDRDDRDIGEWLEPGPICYQQVVNNKHEAFYNFTLQRLSEMPCLDVKLPA